MLPHGARIPCLFYNVNTNNMNLNCLTFKYPKVLPVKLAIFDKNFRPLPVLLPPEVGHFRKSAIFTYLPPFEFLKLVENCGLERIK